jgi:hypothetical protein
VIGTGRGETLDDMECVAVIIAGAIEPGFLALPGHVDNQRVALPVPA